MKYLFFILIAHSISIKAERSIHRPKNNTIPYIMVSQPNDEKKYILMDSHLRHSPLHAFDETYFFQNIIPEQLTFRYEPEKSVSSNEVDSLIEKLLEEINNRKKISDFIILKKIDFNFVTKTGFLVLKFKNLPFVLKLFIETARSLTHPSNKAFQERGLFIMGGCLRYFGGFTRVKNADLTRQKIENTEWENKVVIPRKWFWLPKNGTWLTMEIHNLSNEVERIKMPSVYAIICDEIYLGNKRPSYHDCLLLSTATEYLIDPNLANFLSEKETNKIAVIDTEHFPTMIGAIKRIPTAHDYMSWYAQITKHYVSNKFFYFKDERIARQKHIDTYYKI